MSTQPEEKMEELSRYNSQWVSFHIRDHLTDGEISIQNTVIGEGGDFHSPDVPSKNMTEEEIEQLVIPANGVGEICARGRRGSEGYLDLYHGDERICELHWENRTGEYVNLVEVRDSSDKYRVEHGGWSPEAGPLGHVYMDIFARNKK